MDTQTEVMYHRDPVYLDRRRAQVNRLLRMSETELRQQVDYLTNSFSPTPRSDGEAAQKSLRELYQGPLVPDVVKTNAIISADGYTPNASGAALIRQDLEPVLYALFVR